MTQKTTRGFTLLEVLAASLIFSMVVTVLIGSSTETVQRALISVNRLEASQIADRELALLETLLNMQQTPPEDKEEFDEEFVIRVISSPALEDLDGGESGGGSGFPSLSGGGGGGLGSLLTLQAPGIDQFLLRYDIVVEWIEGANPSSLTRTTYAFDWEGARAALPDLFGDETGGEAGDNPANDLGGAATDALKLLSGGRQ